MINQDKLTLLRQTPLFQGLKQRQMEQLAKRFVERGYETGDNIVTQGKGGEGFFIITEGQVEVCRGLVDGSCAVLHPLHPGDFFGEMALLTDCMRTASVVATKPTKCLVLTRWDFLSLLREDADMAVAVLQELADRFSRLLGTL